MKALVTGGAGFIGSNLAIELAGRGNEVTVLDDMSLGSMKNLAEVKEDIEIVEGDVRDLEVVSRCVEDVDVIFHNAARSSAPMHEEDPYEGAEVNLGGFINVAEEGREKGAEKVVYASTSSMYGSVEPPHKEDTGEYPVNLYSASKMSRELYAKSYSESSSMEFVGLRYFSVYGPRERSKGRFANLASQFLWKMMEGERPVIYGNGEQTRDLTFVEDVVRANILAAESEVTGEVVNVGTGVETSLNDLVEKLNRLLGTDIEPKYVENPIENYVMRTQADLERIRESVGYEPEFSLDEGLRKSLEFYRKDLEVEV